MEKKDSVRSSDITCSHPYNSANWLSRLTVHWMSNVLQLGSKRPLEKKDLFSVRTEDSMEQLVDKLESEWKKEIINSSPTGCKPRLWKVLLRMFSWKEYTLLFVLKVLRFLSTIFLPTLLWFFLSDLEKETQSGYSAASFLFVTGIILLAIMKGMSKNHSSAMTEVMGNRLKVACIGFVYKKILRELKRSDVQKIMTGKTINLVSNDAQRFERLVYGLHFFMFAPLDILGCCTILFLLIGWKALVGIGLFIILITYITAMSNENAKLRHKTTLVTDQRLEVMNEVVTGIRAVKMFAWEWNFTESIRQLRRKEMWFIRLRGLIVSSLYSLGYTTAPLAGFISVVTLITGGEHITAFKMFTIFSCLNIINFSVAIAMGYTLPLVTEGNIAIKRIERFLLREYDETCVTFATRHGPRGFLSVNLKTERRLGPSVVQQERFKGGDPKLISVLNKRTISCTEGNDLVLSSVSASWDRREQRQALKDISFSVCTGQMMAVTGPVGSGKSSLLMAILRELPTISGTVSVNGRVAYVPQIPWVFSGTIRDNILFGRPFDNRRYFEILDICCLLTDLNNFPKGDLTEIGHRGVSLSGGQRGRVSLARALYSDADIYLLDDPLSAVDAKVAKHLFDNCICGFLSGKTRVFVTHQMHYLTNIDNIIVLRKGAKANERIGFHDDDGRSWNIAQVDENESDASMGASPDQPFQVLYNEEEVQDLKEEKEDRRTGAITWNLYWNYFRTALPAPVIIVLFLLVLGMKGLLVATYWWASQVSTVSPEQQRSSKTLAIYGALVGSSLLANVLSSYLFYSTLLKASVVKAPLLYFDKTPLGRILNRFSKDIGSMDNVLPPQFLSAVEVCLFAISTILLPVAANFWLLLVALPLVAIALYYGRYYLKSSREIKRLEAITCSPVYSHISETIAGLEIIRSSQMEQDFLRRLFNYQDENTSALMMVITSTLWLGVRMTFLCSLLVAAAGFGAIIVTQNPALAGMSLAFLLESLDEVQYGVKVSSEVENLMTSVERVMAYTKLREEPGYSTADRPPESWPQRGSITISGLSLRYIEGGPRVLKDINLSIADKERIGVAGRTGAGKSSLVASLLRMPDPDGKVFIDGIDIGTLNLQTARRSMAVIAQDPVLFGGTLRRNLDPFTRYTDLELWTALEEVQLKEMVEKLPGQLNYQLKESGSNFSVGERQLVCLARALVQNSKIIIMDEATANVDFRTDRLIQEVIRDKFKDSTVLTIAHRLNTIMDYDKVLVLDAGRVVEFDKPEVLIRNDGVFAGLVKNVKNSEQEAKNDN